jgi:hypothetical protein
MSAWRSRRLYASALVLIIIAGLAIRHRGFGIPWPVAKYGGSTLWAAMVYGWVRLISPRQPMARSAALALAIAVMVEASRLYHAPWLDAFRVTTAGALLLGRFFSPFDMLAYALGVGLAALADRTLNYNGRHYR